MPKWRNFGKKPSAEERRSAGLCPAGYATWHDFFYIDYSTRDLYECVTCGCPLGNHYLSGATYPTEFLFCDSAHTMFAVVRRRQ